MKKVYNKNAREKALLEEAYSNVYNEAEDRIYLQGDLDGHHNNFKSISIPATADKLLARWQERGLQVVDKPSEDEDNEAGKEDEYDQERKDNIEYSKRVEGSPNAIHDVLEKVYEISGRLHGEIEDLGIFLPREHSKRWTKLEELQKELESVVDEYGDDKFWAARQEDRKYSAEPRGGYHEW